MSVSTEFAEDLAASSPKRTLDAREETSYKAGLADYRQLDDQGGEATFDDFNNWFPHPSPDGRSIVFLSYQKDVSGHQDVQLRVMTLSDRRIMVLAKLFGGQGTMNVPSWSPDSAKVAFVSYQLLLAEEADAK